MGNIKNANNYGSLPRSESYHSANSNESRPRSESYGSVNSNDSLDPGFVDDFLQSDSPGLSALNPPSTSDGQPTSSKPLQYKRFVFFGKKVEFNVGETLNWTLRKAYNSIMGAPGKVWRNLSSFCLWSSSESGEKSKMPLIDQDSLDSYYRRTDAILDLELKIENTKRAIADKISNGDISDLQNQLAQLERARSELMNKV